MPVPSGTHSPPLSLKPASHVSCVGMHASPSVFSLKSSGHTSPTSTHTPVWFSNFSGQPSIHVLLLSTKEDVQPVQ